MTLEDKELCLVDICARLPYGVKGTVEIEVSTGEYSIESGHLLFMEKEIDVELLGINNATEEIEVCPLNDIDLDGYDYVIDDFIQYLRPMSSMTDEEKKEYENCYQSDDTIAATLLVDFYNKKHFDYRGLIPMGLALEASEGMYNIKEK